MNKFLQFNPSGKFLMDYCYVNLWFYENEIALMSGGSFFEKIQFYFLKGKVKKNIQNVSALFYELRCFDLDSIISSMAKENDEAWDILLYYIIIRNEAKSSMLTTSISIEDKMNSVLNLYLEEIKVLHADSYEILNLKIKKIELFTKYDLEFAEQTSKMGRGQFTNP